MARDLHRLCRINLARQTSPPPALRGVQPMVPVARGARHGRRLLRRRSKSETITIADPRIRGVLIREGVTL
jgi:hypothetical protein